MGTAKPVSLSVRPLQVSHLCFEVDGILGELNAQLGESVKAFDFAAFYAELGSVPTVPTVPSRLLYNFLEIQAFVKNFSLAALRAEASKAALNKAINARQNAYFAKYGNIPTIISRMNDNYSPSVANSKPNRLAILSAIAQQQADELKAAYISDSRTAVVKTTGSVLNSSTQSTGRSIDIGQSNQEDIGFKASGKIKGPPPDGRPFSWENPGPVNIDLHEGTSDQATTSTSSASQRQTIVNTDYGYRIPFLESQAQNQRAQISLIDEQFAQFMSGQNLPNLAQVFQNEINSIDSDVYQLQIALLNTFLMSPIRGTVTGIYRNPGDAVKAGEPVIRVEDTAVILLVATLIYRGPILIGSTVTVKTALFDSSSSPTTVIGNVVAVRGRFEDDQWEVIVQCHNRHGGNPIFPLGYHFDYDDTTVSIS